MLKKELEFLYKNVPALHNEKIFYLTQCQIDSTNYKNWRGIACLLNSSLAISCAPGLFSTGKSEVISYDLIKELSFNSAYSLTIKIFNKINNNDDRLEEVRLNFYNSNIQDKLNYVNFSIFLICKVFSLSSLSENNSFFLFYPIRDLNVAQKAKNLLYDLLSNLKSDIDEEIESIILLCISSIELALGNNSTVNTLLSKISCFLNNVYRCNFCVLFTLSNFLDKSNVNDDIIDSRIINLFISNKSISLENKIKIFVDNLAYLIKLYKYFFYSKYIPNKQTLKYLNQLFISFKRYDLFFSFLLDVSSNLLESWYYLCSNNYEKACSCFEEYTKQIKLDEGYYNIISSNNYCDFNIINKKFVVYLQIALLEYNNNYTTALDVIKKIGKSDLFLLLLAAKFANEENTKPNWLFLPNLDSLENINYCNEIDFLFDVIDYLIFCKNYNFAMSYISFAKLKLQQLLKTDNNLDIYIYKLHLLEEECLLLSNQNPNNLFNSINDSINNLLYQNLWFVVETNDFYWYLKKIYLYYVGAKFYNQNVKAEILQRYIYTFCKSLNLKKIKRYTESLNFPKITVTEHYENSSQHYINDVNQKLFEVKEKICSISSNSNFIIELNQYIRKIANLNIARKRPVTIAICGEYNSGKSTFINAIIGENVLPTGKIPTTCVPCLLRYSSQKLLVVHYTNIELCSYHDISEINKILNQRTISENKVAVSYIELLLPNKTLENIILIDLPGLNSLFFRHEELSKNFLEYVDEVWWISDANQHGKKLEIEFIKQNLSGKFKLYGFLNHIDEIPDDEIEEVYNTFVNWFNKFGTSVCFVSALSAIKCENVRLSWQNWLDPLLNNANNRRKNQYIHTLQNISSKIKYFTFKLSSKMLNTVLSNDIKDIIEIEKNLETFSDYFFNLIIECVDEFIKDINFYIANYKYLYSKTFSNFLNELIYFSNFFYILVERKIIPKLSGIIRDFITYNLRKDICGNDEKYNLLLKNYTFAEDCCIDKTIDEMLVLCELNRILSYSLIKFSNNFSYIFINNILDEMFFVDKTIDSLASKDIQKLQEFIKNHINSYLIKYIKNLLITLHSHLHFYYNVLLETLSEIQIFSEHVAKEISQT